MLSEYHIDLCFIRPREDETAFPGLERQLRRVFAGVLTCTAERKLEGELEIATVQLSGWHDVWSGEQEVVRHLEAASEAGQLQHLYGYRIELAQLEERTACAVERRGAR